MEDDTTRGAPEPSAVWWARRQATSLALSRTPAMVAATRAVQRVAGADRATLRFIVGLNRLRDHRHGRIVAFSGSYNPLTMAHIGLVETALAFGYDAALWILPAASVDKERVSRAALVDRLVQMRTYIRTTQRQGVALVNRGLYVEQAVLVRRVFPDAELSLLVGFDKVAQIFDARYYQDRDAALRALFLYARLLVAPRAGRGEADLAELLARPENEPFASYVTFLPTPPELADDSSTEARAEAAAGRADALRSLIPPEAVALTDTGAYETRENEAPGRRYSQRLAWLHGLERG